MKEENYQLSQALLNLVHMYLAYINDLQTLELVILVKLFYPNFCFSLCPP